MRYLITGGAGFIGSSLARLLSANSENNVIVLDKLTYSGNLKSLDEIYSNENFSFKKEDICNSKEIENIISSYSPNIIFHLAAETHVDNSITNPKEFINTNIFGTYSMLEGALKYWNSIKNKQKNFRFIHVSTDEVYGDLEINEPSFKEENKYYPSSPYSATKAGSDHLVYSWFKTYGLPIIITNCSNNYGPFQNEEKLIPLMITNALKGKELPIYGEGKNIRDWLYVDDHSRALVKISINGRIGNSYNIGANCEKNNIDIVKKICTILDKYYPNNKNFSKHSDLITFVEDRKGHDMRYSINAKKVFTETGWKPKETFESGLMKTIEWYINNLGLIK